MHKQFRRFWCRVKICDRKHFVSFSQRFGNIHIELYIKNTSPPVCKQPLWVTQSIIYLLRVINTRFQNSVPSQCFLPWVSSFMVEETLKGIESLFQLPHQVKKGYKIDNARSRKCTMARGVRCSIKDSRLFRVLKGLKIDGLSHLKSKVSVLSLVSRQGFMLTHTHVPMDFQYQSSLIVTTAHKPLFFLLWRLACQICAEHLL